MNKKILLCCLIGLIVLQVLIPGLTISRHYNTLRNGSDYKFIVMPYDPYDPFRGRYVELRPAELTYYTYSVLGRDARGYATVLPESGQDMPKSGEYIKNLQLNRYYMNEQMAPIAERIQQNLSDDDVMYLLVKVKDGHYVIEGLYLNDISIETYIMNEKL